jgi:membrane-bound lytic murein transglycosylase D
MFQFAQAQTPKHMERPSDTLKKDPFVNTVEQSLMFFYQEYAGKKGYDSIIKSLNYEANDVPRFSDEVYCNRLEEMNKMSPFHLDCNNATLSTIKFFAEKRRGFIRVAMGRSELYFDMFEEKLAEYGLPIELKYLAVIESGLRPQVKSRAGALGLWQFMYKTGLYFGLKENSYIDERMDPALATDAACRYLRQLYGIYGDWNLALAAYNAGPGNVNKAIRRSGNKTTYWEVRPYLPAETQGYVPNFIAAAYMMTYHAEHNIVPVKAEVHNAQLDTMCLSSGVHMATITKLIDWPLEQIKELNPVYKTTYIPQTRPAQCITGPLDRIGLLVGLEDSLYKLEKAIYSTGQYTRPVVTPEVIDDTTGIDSLAVPAVNTDESYFYHVVKSGETMTAIATKYGVGIEQIMEWNALRTTNLYAGQRLKIKGVNKPPITPPVVTPTKQYYSVRSGDTFSRIADRHRMSQDALRRLNPGININRLTVGQRIRVR